MFGKSALISILLLGMTLLTVLGISARGIPTVVATNLENIPKSIGEYQGVDGRFDQSVYDELNADQHLYRHYRRPDGCQVDLYIGYYGTAKGGRTQHNPYACLPGAGWGIATIGKVALSPPYLKRPAKVNYLLAVKGNRAVSVLHWYQSAGTKVLSSGLAQNIHRFYSRILFNRNDGAFVRVSAIAPLDQIKSADAQTRSFAQKIISLLPLHWPEEK